VPAHNGKRVRGSARGARKKRHAGTDNKQTVRRGAQPSTTTTPPHRTPASWGARRERPRRLHRPRCGPAHEAQPRASRRGSCRVAPRPPCTPTAKLSTNPANCSQSSAGAHGTGGRGRGGGGGGGRRQGPVRTRASPVTGAHCPVVDPEQIPLYRTSVPCWRGNERNATTRRRKKFYEFFF